jgi:hypothetical protein
MNPLDNQQVTVLNAGNVVAPGFFALNRATSLIFEVSGGTVNYENAQSFNPATNAPTGWTAQPDSPYAAGLYEVQPRTNYGRFTVASGSPTVSIRRLSATA